MTWDVAAIYKVNEVVQMSVATITEFANEVGIVALIPYIRQAVADLSQRVFGSPILMPMFQRGELSFSPDDAKQES